MVNRRPHHRPAPTPAQQPSAELVNQHLGSRVKQLRTSKHWSLEALAQASGVSRSMLSEIEREQANPTLAVTMRIAQAFGMSLGELVQVPSASSSIAVIRADDKVYHYRTDEACHIRTLSPLNLEKDVELYQIRLARGGQLRSAAHYEGTREFLTVQKGEVRVESGDDHESLRAGDSANYRADVPHCIVNAGQGEALVYLVVIYS